MTARASWRVWSLGLTLLALGPAPASPETLGEVYRRVNPSVVVIRARGSEVTAEGMAHFREIGSGVLVSADGKVATAAHVVHTMNEIVVEFLGEDPVPARVISSEPRADLSIIQVETVPRDAVVAKLADSDAYLVGDSVFIVGAPYGLSHSLSQGVISARWAPNTVTKDFPLAEFFQTDAVINTGNSGGPMFSRSGDLIGIVSHNISKSGGSEGLGFVVTSNTVRQLLGQRGRRYYGLDIMLLTGDMAQAFNLPQPGGFLIKQVALDSIGARLGLRGGDRVGIIEGQSVVVGGDILLSAQGIQTASNEELNQVLKTLETIKPGDELRVTVLRDGKVQELSIKIPGQ
ncbi:MAG TPA: trypsin-like peptidase domain-containing protein [Methylomirabilota bacterium]|nr:trypsin-like peptidase domain-containing protein [Methylomirabilota bacterium]